MNFGPATYGLALIAGTLSTLSPCVLPLLPVLIASAVNAHRWGALALGTGLALSFMIVGIFLATLGASLGLDPETFRSIGAVTLAIFGLILLMPKLQDLFARATSTLSNSGNQLLARVTFGGLPGQFLIGILLGVVWSPCVGPTLGAATTLASQGKNLGQIGLLMLIFGVGAAAPLVLLGSVSRASMTKIRGRLVTGGRYGKQLLGVVLLALGVMIATGADKTFEAWILDHTPDWVTAATTKY
ncbi:MAG: cytochrome c biogenesis CcdA family protein [Steroidobacteraceae bacterium]